MIFCFVRETKQMTLEELDRKCYHTGFMSSLLINKFDRGILRAHKKLSLIRIESLAALHRETTCPAQKCPDASAGHRKGRSSKCLGDIPVSPGVCQSQSILFNSPVQNALLDNSSGMIGDENRRPVDIVKCASGGWQRLLQGASGWGAATKTSRGLSKEECLARKPHGMIATQFLHFVKGIAVTSNENQVGRTQAQLPISLASPAGTGPAI